MQSSNVSRRAAIAGFGAIAAFGLACAAPAVAQDYPTKPITMIIPWPAGGSSDVSMRAIAEAASKRLGQPFIMDNKPGGAGSSGPATMAASAKPDGYTIAQMPISVVRIPIIQKTTFETMRDFTYISRLTGYTFGVTTKADSPFNSWADVVKFAKENPGKVTYGSPGTGTSLHIGMEMMAAKEGVKFTHVPFKGGAETNAAVLGGHTMLQADSTGWKPLVEGGQIRLLNIWTAERSKVWPNVPTLKELGYPYVFDSPFGVAGPKGMDPAIVKKLDAAFREALTDKDVIETLARYDMFPRYLGSDEYRKSVQDLVEVEMKALTDLGMARK
jgi:tripartite-type tricarboxylate transporter receptor subunit TctC